VLVDTVDSTGAAARGFADAPEIDGLVQISGTGSTELCSGDIRRVRVERADEYDLFAVLD
jgi:ribosomal protein S12 methylthiotransferase